MLGDGALGKQAAEHLVGGPAHRAHRRDPETLVDGGPARVVDARHDVLDTIGLTGNARSENVGVVPAAHRGKGVGVLDAGLDQRVPVKAEAGHPFALETVPQTAKGRAVAVDDSHVVALALETECQGRANPAAAHNDEVHAATLHRTGTRSRPNGYGGSAADVRAGHAV